MAKIGYLFLSRNLVTHDEDLAWMKEFGCKDIIEEDGIQEKFRPEWRRMLAHIKRGDEIVISKFSNALRGVREFGAFLGLCKDYEIRIISIQDKIDSKGELFPDTSAIDVLDIIACLSYEATQIRRSESRMLQRRKDMKPKITKESIRMKKEKTVVSMYNAGHSIEDIWKVSGYRSRTSVFRVLNRNGVQLNRGRHQGPIKTHAERKNQ
jgi:DNA invertase Pin-like site-specific DNA recombinase